MRNARPPLSGYDELRARFIRETELALFLGALRPETVCRIPIVEVGKGRFSRQFADEFWRDVIGLSYPPPKQAVAAV